MSNQDPVSTNSDSYFWNGVSGGLWDIASNWIDITSGVNPSTFVPGSNNAVTINGTTGSVYSVIQGGGDSASLALTGLVDLSGSYGTGALTVGSMSGSPDTASFSSGSLALGADSGVSATSVDIIDGSVSVSGTGASLTDSGAMTIGTPQGNNLSIAGQDYSYSYGPAASIIVSSGASLSSASLTVADGSLSASDAGTSVTIGGSLTLGVTPSASLVSGNPYYYATSGSLSVSSGAQVSVAGAITADDGAITVSGAGSSLTSAAAATLGLEPGYYASANLAASGGGSIQLGNLSIAQLSTNAGSVYVTPYVSVDSSSSIELGSAGGAASGAITIDSGNSITAAMAVQLTGNVVDNGTISESAGVLTINGALSGTGQVQIGANSTVTMDGAGGTGTVFDFAGNAATLEIGSGSIYDYSTGNYTYTPYAITSTLSGFATGDGIIVDNAQITSAIYTYAGNNTGTLTLFSGSTVIETLTLAGDYTGQTFFISPTATGGSAISLLANPVTSPSPVSATSDTYIWNGVSGGLWDDASNWIDATSGTNPPADVPGLNNAVTINGATGSVYSVIQGGGDSASLALTGLVDLSGSYGTGALTVGSVSGSPNIAPVSSDSLALGADSGVSATSVDIVDGSVSVSGTGASLADSGAMTIGTPQGSGSLSVSGGAQVSATGAITADNSAITVSGAGSSLTSAAAATLGLDFGSAKLAASGGGSIQLGNLSIAQLSTNAGSVYVAPYVSVDSSSSIELGSAGGAASGAITIDSGNSITAAMAVQLTGNVVDNGTISESAGVLTINGALSGTGQVQIGANSTVTMDGAGGTGTVFDFAGNAATLEIGSGSIYDYSTGNFTYTPYAITSTLSGFATGDGIIVDNVQITNAVYIYAGNNTGTLTLFSGSSVIETLTLAGDYTGQTFFISPTTTGGSAISLLANPVTSPSPVSATSDTYIWNGVSGGLWDDASNWIDATSGTNPPADVPGLNNAVTINGATGSVYSVIQGGGDSASLALTGLVDLSGSYGTGALTVGSVSGSPNIAPVSSDSLALGADSGVSATSVDIVDGSVSVSGTGASLADSGAMTIGTPQGSGSLSVSGGAQVSATGAITADNSAITVSGAGSSLTSAAAATLGLDFGSAKLAASGGGSIQLGNLSIAQLSTNAGSVYVAPYVSVDSSSSIELGSAGGAASGAITIDSGNSITAAMAVQLTGNVVDNGTISESAGVLTINGALSGTGQVQIGANSTVTMDGAGGTGTVFDFAGNAATLEIGSGSIYDYSTGNFTYTPYAITSTLSGFATGDGIIVDNVQITNAVYTYAGNNTGTLTLFSGSTAIETLTLTGDYTGQTFFISPTATGGSAISLLARPGNTTPASEVVLAGVATQFGGFSVNDTNVQATSITVMLSDTSGQLSASATGGAAITGSGTKTLTISGTVADVDASLATLSFLSNSTGTDTISVTAVDSLGNTALQENTQVTVVAAAPPTVTAPATAVYALQNNETSLASISVQYADAVVPGELVSVAISDANGLLSMNSSTAGGGGIISGSGTTSLSISGTLSEVDADLATLSYQGGTIGTDTVTVTAQGTHGGAAAPDSFTVQTIALPTISAPSAVTLTKGYTDALAVSIDEPGNMPGEIYNVTLSDTNGLLSVSNVAATVTGSGSNELTISGTLTNVNATLATLEDTESSVGSDQVALQVTDSFGDTANASIVVSVMDTTTVAQFLANQAKLDQSGADIEILDTAANVAANFDSLNADPHIASIRFTDSGTLTLTAQQSLNDVSAFSKIAEPYIVTISDSSANVLDNIAALSADISVSSIAFTDNSSPTFTLTAAQALDYVETLKKITSTYSIFISDTAANLNALSPADIGTLLSLPLTQVAPGGVTVQLPSDTTVTTAQLSPFENESDTIDVNGKLNNTGAILTTGSSGELASIVLESGGTIAGGTIQNMGSGLTISGGMMQGVDIEGPLNIQNAALHVADGLVVTDATGSNAGSITIGSGSQTGILYLDDTQTLDNATVTLAGNGSVIDQYITLAAYDASGGNPSETLTFGTKLTINQSSGYAAIESSGNTGISTIINNGAINLSGGGAKLIIDPTNFVNNGAMSDTGGAVLTIGAVSGSGYFIIGANSQLNLVGAVQSGNTLIFSGTGAVIEIGSSSTVDSQTGNNVYTSFGVGAAISGFVKGDEIIVDNTDITQALYTATGATTGTLALLNGNTTVETLELSGSSYTSASFTSNYGINGLNESVITVSTTPVPPVVTIALADDTGALTSDDITSDPTLTGTADPYSTVYFTVDGQTVSGTAVANANGVWTYTPSGLSDGQHTIAASETNGFGLTGSASLAFQLETTPPTVTIDPSLTIDSVASGSTVNVTLSGTVTKPGGGLARVSIYQGAVNSADFLGYATGQNGQWTFKATVTEETPTLFSAVATDIAGNTTSVSQTLTATLAAPTLSAPSSATVVQGYDTPVSISIAEGGNIQGETYTVTISDAAGLLSASGDNVSGSGSNNLTISGSLVDVNAALATLTDADPVTLADQIEVNVVDNFGTEITAPIGVTVVPLSPQFTRPSEVTALEGASMQLGVSVSDPGVFAGQTITAIVTDTYGTLSASGSNVVSSGDNSLKIVGSVQQVNAALATLTFTESSVQPDVIKINLSDTTGDAASTSVNVTTLTQQASTSTSYNSLFAAILSMDSYNRGYGAGIGGLSDATGTQIGEAKITNTDGTAAAQSDGFYAVAYNWGSQNVISYRGTDNLNLLSSANDILNGWVQGAGILSSQSKDAEQFYQDVTGRSIYSNQFGPNNVLLVGHSLGGGLAGFIASITGDRADIYDNMPYAQSAMNQVILADIGLGFTDFSGLFDGTVSAPVALPRASSITSYFTTGEILAAVRLLGPALAAPFVSSFRIGAFLGTGQIGILTATEDAGAALGYDTSIPFQQNSQQGLNAQSGTTLLGLSYTPIELHSMSLLVILQYAQYFVSDSSWKSVGQQLFSAYFNDDLGKALGFIKGVTGSSDPSAQMLTEIAYSAINQGYMPFGDTGIPALFHDADALGQFYNSQYSSSVISMANAPSKAIDLADIAVEYAGLLADTRDTVASHANTGVITYVTDFYVEVNLSNLTWDINGSAPKIVGESDLLKLFYNTQLFSSYYNFSIYGDVYVDNLIIGTDNPTSHTVDLSKDSGIDAIDAAGGSATYILGSGLTFFLAGSGTSYLQVNSNGLGLDFTGGNGTSTIDASSVKTNELLDVIGGNGSITVDMGVIETLLIEKSYAFVGSISGFTRGNVIDLQGVLAESANLGIDGTLVVHETDGAKINLQLLNGASYQGDFFETTADGHGGTDIRIASIDISPVDPTQDDSPGKLDFTLTRKGDVSSAETVYVSTTDGSTVLGEDYNTGDFVPLDEQAVTFAAGDSSATVSVSILGNDASNNSDGETKIFGLQATDSASSQTNFLGTDSFNLVLPPQPKAIADGCPHFTTFDGLHYDFQGAGEFIASKSTVPGNDFQVQMRIEPEFSAYSPVSIITQIAVQVGADRITFDATRNNGTVGNPGFSASGQVVWVDGAAVDINQNNPVLTLKGGTITEISSEEYQVKLNTGEVVTINPFGDGMGLSIALSPTDGPGSVQGFFGSYQGQAKDFQLPDGTVLQQPLTQDQLYQTFANAWRVTDATSLLDYGSGQNTATFTDTQYPREILTLADFPASVVSAAAAIVSAAGITDPILAANAEFDYITMGNPSIIKEDAAVAGAAGTSIAGSTAAVITEHVTPPPSIGVQAAATAVVEATSGTTSVTFDVQLTSAASTDTVVNYTVTAGVDYVSADNGGKTFFDAADFGGTLPTGSVTVAAGLTQATFTVNLPASALASAPDKWLGVTITSPAGNQVYGPTAQTEVVSSTPVAGSTALPVIELLTTPGSITSENSVTLSHSGSAYTLNLGEVLSNEAMPKLQFAIANTAVLGADSLQSVVTGNSGSGFVVSGDQSATIIDAGNVYNNLYLQPVTTTFGSNSETVTLALTDTNASGYSGALPNITLTVEDTVVAPAQASLSTTAVQFANARVGSAESQTIAVTNSATTPAANLDVAMSTGAGTTASGTVSGLAAGATDSTDLTVGLDTSTAGAISGKVTLNLASDLGNGVTVPALPSQTVTVSGNVYREAGASVADLPGDIIVHVGDNVSNALTITNAAANDGYSENLIAAVAGVSGAITASGSTGDISAQASSNAIGIGFSTASAGSLSGAVTLDFQSDGTGIDGFAATGIGTQTVQVNATVDNYASAALEKVSGTGTLSGNAANGYTLDLGSVQLGSNGAAINLEALNTATGVADLLKGDFVIGGNDAGVFANTGFSAFSGLVAGQAYTAPTVTLNTTQAGTFSETITFDPTGYNASGYSGSLSPETLTVTGTVVLPPSLTSASYNAVTGVFTFAGNNLNNGSGSGIVLNDFGFGIGSDNSFTFNSSDTISNLSANGFTVALSGADQETVNALVNANGLTNLAGSYYNLTASNNWDSNSGRSIASLAVSASGAASTNVSTELQVGGITSPGAAEVDSSGNLYVVNTGNNSLQEIQSGGGTPETLLSGFNYPLNDIAADKQGNVFAYDSYHNSIVEVAAKDGSVTTLISGLYAPYGIGMTFDQAGDAFLAAGVAVKEIAAGTHSLSTIATGFIMPQGIATDSIGNLYVADTGHNAVKEILAGSHQVITLVSSLNGPHGIVVDGENNVYFTDSKTGAVDEYAASTKTVSTLASGLSDPTTLTLDNAGNLYVTESTHTIDPIADTAYVFNTPLKGSSPVVINNLIENTQQIQLSQAVFTAFAGETTVSAVNFSNAAAATSAMNDLFYNAENGGLYYEAGGDAGSGAIEIAIIGSNTHPASLSAGDFKVVA